MAYKKLYGTSYKIGKIGFDKIRINHFDIPNRVLRCPETAFPLPKELIQSSYGGSGGKTIHITRKDVTIFESFFICKYGRRNNNNHEETFFYIELFAHENSNRSENVENMCMRDVHTRLKQALSILRKTYHVDIGYNRADLCVASGEINCTYQLSHAYDEYYMIRRMIMYEQAGSKLHEIRCKESGGFSPPQSERTIGQPVQTLMYDKGTEEEEKNGLRFADVTLARTELKFSRGKQLRKYMENARYIPQEIMPLRAVTDNLIQTYFTRRHQEIFEAAEKQQRIYLGTEDYANNPEITTVANIVWKAFLEFGYQHDNTVCSLILERIRAQENEKLVPYLLDVSDLSQILVTMPWIISDDRERLMEEFKRCCARSPDLKAAFMDRKVLYEEFREKHLFPKKHIVTAK